MRKVANLSAQDRKDIFSEAAARLGINPTIIEKDFWVCLALKILFMDWPFSKHLVFKGGTSLSKVYRLIERFSEDIDLVLDWRLLGVPKEPEPPGSNAQRDRFNKEVNRLAGELIRDKLAPQLNDILQAHVNGLTASVDGADLQVVNVRYPASFAEAYIRPEVRLEIGPLAAWVPSEQHTIQPYAAQIFPKAFSDPNCSVLTIVAERTFWEKATILHQETHRTGRIPSRYSRHYYDLFQLAKSPIKDSACSNLHLLKDVVEFKQRFYPSAWARYDLAVPGTMRLLPAGEEHLKFLAQDFKDMTVMLFGKTKPAFEEIVDALRDLEVTINSLAIPPRPDSSDLP